MFHFKGNLSNIDTPNIIPVELNAYLHKNLRILSYFNFRLGRLNKYFLYKTKARTLLVGINAVSFKPQTLTNLERYQLQHKFHEFHVRYQFHVKIWRHGILWNYSTDIIWNYMHKTKLQYFVFILSNDSILIVKITIMQKIVMFLNIL